MQKKNYRGSIYRSKNHVSLTLDSHIFPLPVIHQTLLLTHTFCFIFALYCPFIYFILFNLICPFFSFFLHIFLFFLFPLFIFFPNNIGGKGVFSNKIKDEREKESKSVKYMRKRNRDNRMYKYKL